jgi:hypothetical protein
MDDGFGHAWFSGGVAGLGWVGNRRVSVGLDMGEDAGVLAGHEIGHNFGRQHAPCGDPGDVDPFYPYANGIIGEYGLDLEEEVVVMPDQAMDMMSYCGPEWISDYTYEALLEEQLRVGGHTGDLAPTHASPTAEGMIVRATLDELGQATLQPVYVAPSILHNAAVGEGAAVTSAATTSSGYAFEAVAADGSIVGSYPAELLQAGEKGVSVRQLWANIPTMTTAESLRLVYQGQALAERTLSAAHALPMQQGATALTAQHEANEVHLTWGMGEQPALVRYSADGGQSWMVLGVDVSGGQMTIDPTYLPERGVGEFQVIVADAAEPLVLSTTNDSQ